MAKLFQVVPYQVMSYAVLFWKYMLSPVHKPAHAHLGEQKMTDVDTFYLTHTIFSAMFFYVSLYLFFSFLF